MSHEESSKTDEGQSRLSVGLGMKYCHMHGKYNCQTCIDGWVDAGIEQDKKKIERLNAEIVRLRRELADAREMIGGEPHH